MIMRFLHKGETMMTKRQMTGNNGTWIRATLLAACAVLIGASVQAADLLHNSQDTGSTKWQSQGGWGVAGGRYGQFTCATCHEPDADNLKNIRRVINTMDGSNWPNGTPANTVYFLNQTSMGDDSAPRTSSNRICEVCHSQNRFHNYSTTSNLTHGGTLNHPTPKQNCTSCHTHNTGFKAACGGCHGNPPTTASIGGDYGLVGTPRPSNALQPGQAGAHATHTTTRSMVCDTCHYISNGTIKMPNQSGTIQIGFFGFGGKVTSGTYLPYTSATRGYRFASGTPNTTIAAAATTYAAANKCQNVYCHGGGSAANGKAPLTGGTNQSPRWDASGQNSCGSCHGTTNATPPTMGSHVKHASSASGYNYYCDMCHPVSGDNSHVQGNVRWQFSATDPRVTGARYQANGSGVALNVGSTGDLAPSASYGQCSNIYCHTDGKGGPAAIATPTWGQSFPADCSGCHGGPAGSAVPIATGKHTAHINNASVLGANFTCGDCHGKSATGNVVSSITAHVNTFVDYSGAKAGNSSAYAAGVCSATYCHTDGKGTAKNMTTAGWNSAASLDCTGCHGSDSAPAFTSTAGEPNYANAGSAAARANSHEKHVATGGVSTCESCHGSTMTGSALNNSGKHLDRSIDVVQGGTKSFTWAAGAKSCSNINCHGTGSPLAVWGASMPADCTGCHGGNSASAAPLATGKHTVHTNNPAVIGTNYGCADCHAKTVTADRTIGSVTLHGNGFRDYSGTKAGGSATYASGVCSATYCHSDGKGTVKDMATAGWGSAATLDCKGCHGSDAAPAFASQGGEPNYASAGAGLPRANSHEKHVGLSGAATCVNCHSATVTVSGTAIASGSLLHTDRSIDVAQGGSKTFDWTAATKNCSNISCHGTGSPAAVWGATMPADCTGCHGGNGPSASPLATGKHTAHVSNAAVLGDNLGCTECHAKTVSADRSISNTNNHGNTFVDYSGTKAGNGGSYASGVCSATYCHSDGKGTQKDMAAAGWGSATTVDCTGCHGSDAAPAFASQAGEPNYANAGGGQPRANSHQTHASAGASSCDTCHTGTVIEAGTAVKAGSLHLNRAVDVTFNSAKANATWNGLARTCSNITCHGGGNATWGDAGSAGCMVCHNSLSAGHAKHIGDLISTNQVSFYNFTANRSIGTIYRFGCANCHPTDLAKHRNGQVDLTLSRNKVGGSYLVGLNSLNATDSAGYTRVSGSELTCETVYCHSNGRTTSLVLADYRATPNWFGGTFGPNLCGSCHDNPPQYAGQSHYNPASSIGDNGKTPARETGHMVGIHFMNTYVGNKQNGFLGFSSSGNKAHGNPAFATTIGCNVCHSGIVDSTRVDTYAMNGTGSDFRCANCHTAGSPTPLQTGAIANAALHVNGTKNVAFAPVTFKTKAQLANNANALGWTRNGSYKAADSYDSFDLSVATWDSQTKTCLTACHVNQPNITWGAQLKCVSCHANQ